MRIEFEEINYDNPLAEKPSNLELAEFLLDRYGQGFILTKEVLFEITNRLNIVYLINWQTLEIIYNDRTFIE